MTTPPVPDRIAVIGPGRLGSALTAALRPHAREVTLGGRGSDGRGAGLVLLCVPDSEIAAAAAAVAPGPLVGHCSGLTDLAVLAPHEALGLHPLMTVTAKGAAFAGAGAAVAGSTPRALATAHALASALGLRAFALADADRPAYHAAASVAANFLVVLEGWAETLGPADRSLLAPLARAAVEHWAADGAAAALTGPIARGDHATVARQRAAVAERTPEHLALWDALADATARLAGRPLVAAGGAA
jgi:predicted short-subunit dehydrogenase-like oxidoreductase (DUF2520 family)